MKKINFKQLLIATDITRKHCENIDCRENFANVLYRNGKGSDEEVVLIQEHANAFCKPFFIDALNRAINNQPEEATDKQE